MKTKDCADVETEDPLGLVESFRKKYYPQITNIQWNDWKWQLSNSIRTISQIKKFLNITAAEDVDSTKLPLRITPYYLSLVHSSKEIRKTMVPTNKELNKNFGEEIDPLSEIEDSPLPGLVHRYPDRVLLLATNFCSANCRYCTRSRIIENKEKSVDYEKVFDYIKITDPSELRNEIEITDVIQKMIKNGEKIKPLFLKGNYLNVTYPDDIEIAENIFKNFY